MRRATRGALPALQAVMVAAALLGAPRTADAAIADYIGKPVGTIRFIAEGRELRDQSIAELVETPVGQPLSMAQVRETVTHLFSLGRFDDVRVDATMENGRVAIVYNLVPVHPVTSIDFTGHADAPGIDEGALRKAVTDRYSVSPSLGRIEEMQRTVVDALRERGYLHAAALARARITKSPDETTLVFALEPGPRTTIGAIEVNGVTPAQRADVVEQLKLQAGAPYQRDALNARVDKYVDSLHKRGFYLAKAVVTPQFVDGDQVANLTLAVSPGPRVRVVFKGDPLPADKRNELVPIEREGSVDEDLLEDASNAIQDYLRAQGYRDAEAPHSREETGSELVITFDIKRGALYRVEHVEISGNASIPLAGFAEQLRVRDGQPFDGSRLDADVTTIESIYRRRGFGSAKVATGVEPASKPNAAGEIPVVVRIQVREGVRTVIASLRVQGNTAIPEAKLIQESQLRPGDPLFATALAIAREAIEANYANLGYQSATVDVNPGISADQTRADVVFTVREGRQLLVDHIIIVGNVHTSRDLIRRELTFKRGDPLGLAAVTESQARLSSLGLFRRVRINQIAVGNERARDVLVTVEEAPATTLGYGAGFEVQLRVVQTAAGAVAEQQLEFAPRASFEIGRRNLFGKNRSVNLFAGFSLHPNYQTITTGGQTTTSNFVEYRVVGTYREPRIFDTTADAFVAGVQEQQIRSSFDFNRRSVTAEVAKNLNRIWKVSGNYQIQRTEVFNETIAPQDRLLIDRLFPQVLLSSFSGTVLRDTRDDPVDASTGRYFAATGQIAARAIGSEVGFAKTFFTAEGFRTIPAKTHVVFAGAARFGLAHGFPRIVPGTDSQGNPILDINGQPVLTEIEELPASERFFAGGDTTVRGFALDTLGTPATIDVNGFPIGGNAVIVLNAELRVQIHGGVGVVGFLDAGNVWDRVSNIDVTQIRGAVGFGLRYKSPIGPIRVDLGFKLTRQTIAGQLESPTALHISLGQAF